ncbi:MAG TPA: nucleoside deaminase [Cytophagaceae bacterium]|jgi:tRNA(adenine34) deaminase|nr:nucleoside deaminase [Cytophagaceae bacterium]
MLTVQSDEHYMREALKQAQKAFDEDEMPVGAVVVCKDRIIARAHNQTEQLKDPTAHAEILAITAACDYLGSRHLNECTLYVTLEPCCMCAGATFWAQIPKIVYGARDIKRGYSFYNPHIVHPSSQIVTGMFATESEELLKEFFTKLRN